MSRTRQRFEGPSIETALAAAVEHLGPDLEVSEARKVRSGGLLGFFSKERYEVLAAPKVTGVSDAVHAEASAHVDQTIEALMARIEAQESPASFASSLAAANPEWPADLADFIGLDDPPPAGADPEPEDAVLLPDAAPVAALDQSPPSPEPLPTSALVPGPRRVPAPGGPKPGPSAPRPGEPAWSRGALRQLGVPEGILHQLTIAEGADDQEWTMALALALRTELAAQAPAAGEPVDGLVTVSGHGASSAAGLIRAVLDGASPERLHLPAGDVPASAMELALAVRSCLPR